MTTNIVAFLEARYREPEQAAAADITVKRTILAMQPLPHVPAVPVHRLRDAAGAGPGVRDSPGLRPGVDDEGVIA